MREELELLKLQDLYTWGLFAETSRKLQIYSASIKAAVSSLLNYDIFWDHANQHEFLATIDSSVNQVSDLMALLTLAFRAQANSLVLSLDHHMLQEILSISEVQVKRRFADIRLALSYPPDGKPVLVDYEYLRMVLQLLYEVFYTRNPSGKIQVHAHEHNQGWYIDFVGLDTTIVEIIEHMHHCRTQPASSVNMSSENILRLHLMCEILHLQKIAVESIHETDKGIVLRLSVPDPMHPSQGT